MADQLSLFPTPEPHREAVDEARAVGAAAPNPDVVELARQLPPNLYLGTSSWFFPGWQGLVWDRLAAEETLSREGLAAYAQHPLFATVCIDRSFYTPLSRAQYAAYAVQVPEPFRFVVKAPSACTVAWTRGSAGKPQPNPTFLNAQVALEHFVEPCLSGLAAKAGALLFQFSPLGATHLREPQRFIDRLHAFLASLPAGPLYTVEVRDARLLTRRFFSAVREANARYCVAVHPRLPPVAAQAAAMAGSGPGPTVVRWNLNPREEYEAAKARYVPFDRLVDEDESTRESIARLVAAPLAVGEPAFVIANNKAEGSAPLTIRKLAASICAAYTNPSFP